jgi:membrane-associated protease RseP (regulator of RpoE activity)
VTGDLDEGDTIVAVDEVPVRTASDLQDLLASRSAGARFTLTVEHGGRRLDRKVHTEQLPQLSGGVGLGVFVQTRGLRVDLPFEIRFRSRPNVGGPSAGLAYAPRHRRHARPCRPVALPLHCRHRHHQPRRPGRASRRRPEKAVAAERAGAELVPSTDTDDIDEPDLDVRRVDDLPEALRVIEAT